MERLRYLLKPEFVLIWITGLYVMAELSFNHQLLLATTNMLDDATLEGLEFWGRTLSGVGGGLFLWRWLAMNTLHPWRRLFLCLAISIIATWQTQTAMLNMLTRHSTPDDKEATLYAGLIVDPVVEGRLNIPNTILPDMTGDIAMQQTVRALLPTAAIGLRDREARLQIGRDYLKGRVVTKGILENAYRNAIVPPIALGSSLFFGLLNFANFVGALLSLIPKADRFAKGIGVGLGLLLVGYTAIHSNVLTESSGWKEEMQKGLWHKEPGLASLTEFSMRGEVLWFPVTNAAREWFLAGVEFHHPFQFINVTANEQVVVPPNPQIPGSPSTSEASKALHSTLP